MKYANFPLCYLSLLISVYIYAPNVFAQKESSNRDPAPYLTVSFLLKIYA